jgi:hypothetical protein
MADEQKTEKKTSKKETTKKKAQAGEATAAELAAEVVSPPAATARMTRPKKSMKKSKLLPKNKHRLPRRQKKAQQKGAVHLQK